MISQSKECQLSIRKILIAVDDDPISVRAADVGREFAGALSGEVALIHVNDIALEYAGDTGLARTDLLARSEQEGKRLLSGFRERMSLPPTTLMFVELGAPAATITRAAKDWPADLIVIGSHGRSGMRRALLGSVAEGVMRNTPCLCWSCGCSSDRFAPPGPESSGSRRLLAA
jgi:nucleotide-binding universal stress UspA family protein